MTDDHLLLVIKVGLYALIPLGIIAGPLGWVLAAACIWGLLTLRREGW